MISIIPVVLFIVSNLLSDVRTPYYLERGHDPAYVYLVNSLNIAQFIGVGYIEHPGTPVHEFGGGVIKLFFIFAGKSNDIVLDVFQRPETYLRAFNFTLILLNTIALFILGLTTYRIYKNIFAVLLLQLTPLYSIVVFFELTSVNAENFLIFITIVFIIISLKFINEKELSGKKLFYYILGFSIITGAGVATKINFIPFLLLPLIIIKIFLNKILYLTFTVISFFIFVIPAFPYYKFFIRWVKSLIIHNKMYGKGERNIIDWEYYFSNVKNIFFAEKYFAIAYLIILTGLIVILFYSIKYKKNPEKISVSNQIIPEIKFLTGIFLVITFQLLIVAKHYAIHYMLPSFMLLITGMFMLILIMSQLYPEHFKRIKLNYIYSFLIISIISVKIPNVKYLYDDLKMKRDESIKINNFIDNNYPDRIVLSGDYSWNKETGLKFSTSWAGKPVFKYRTLLDKLIPGHLYYENTEERIYCISDTSKNYIHQLLSSADEIIFQSNKNNSIDKVMNEIKYVYNFRNSEFTKVYSNERNEAVYVIKLRK